MTYRGDLYGKFGRKYIKLDMTAEEVDAMVDRITARRDRLREALEKVLNKIGEWKTDCDYRAEPDIQAAIALILAALQEDRDDISV